MRLSLSLSLFVTGLAPMINHCHKKSNLLKFTALKGLDTMPSSAPTSAASTQATLIPAPAHAHAEHLIQQTSCPLGSPVYSLTTANDVINSVKNDASTDVSIIILSLVGPVLLRLFVLFTCYFYDRIYDDEKKKDFFKF